MKQSPTLFVHQMVCALLDDRKTQTRRLMKTKNGGVQWNQNDLPGMRQILRNCPYGQPGDQIWVKETHFAYGRWETRFSAKKKRDEWHFIDMTLECGHQYKYSPPTGLRTHRKDSGLIPGWWKRPSIFMPRIASRITLEITAVRVERLQEISIEDSKAEGAWGPDESIVSEVENYFLCDTFSVNPRLAYQMLWERINGDKSWDANPWVWVIEFKRIAP